MLAKNIKLVDNFDFINWAMKTPNPSVFDPPTIDPEAPITLPADVAELFLSSNGATEFATVEDLQDALSRLVRARASKQLEDYKTADLLPHPPLDSCTPEVQALGESYQMGIDQGVELSIHLCNIEGFLAMIKEYIASTAAIESAVAEHEFGATDGLECRTNYNNIAQFYSDNQAAYDMANDDLMQLYSDIESKLTAKAATLSGNGDFQCWVLTYETYPADPLATEPEEEEKPFISPIL